MKSLDGGVSWTLTNSGMGNRTVSKLLIHPTVPNILLAATDGGVYKSNDGGQSWTRTSNSSNYKDMVFKPNNPSIVYATYSRYFYKSTDTGNTWTQITSGLPTGGYRGAIAVTKDAPDYVYFILTNSRTYYGLYRSTNSGTSFSTMSTTPNIMDYSTDGSGTSGQAWYDLDIAVDPNDKDIVYVGGINIFKSTNGGQTWAINAHWVGQGGADDIHADQHCLEFSPVTDGLYSGNDGGVYFTRDGGIIWNDISSGLAIAQIYKIGQSATLRNKVINGYQDNGTSVYFGFGNWITTIGGDGMECLIDHQDPNYVYGALYYGDIRRSVTGGQSTSTIAKNGANGINETGAWVTPYILHETNPNTMFVGYKNIWRSNNVRASSANSVSWRKLSDNLAGSNSQTIRVLEHSPADTNILYAARADRKLFRTDSACGWNPTWTDLTSGLPVNAFPSDIEAHPTKDNVVYITLYRDIYKSTNYGATWTNISGNLPNITMNCLVYDKNSTEGIYVGTDAGVYYKDSSMTNWVLFAEGLPTNAEITELEIYYDSSDHRKSLIKASTYGRGLWESSLYYNNLQKPIADFYVNDSLGCLGTILTFEDASLYEPNSIMWEISPNYITYLNETDSSSNFPVVRFDSIGNFTVKLIVSNGQGGDTLVKGNFIRIYESLPAASCVTTTTNGNGYGIGIQRVAVANMVSETPSFDGTNSYHDYSCFGHAILEAGQTYEMEVTVGIYNSEYVNAFIDYNNDNDFDDAYEWVMSTGKFKSLHTDTFIVPAFAVKNQKLRMRVVSDFNSISGNACKTLSYGESEDYSVIINEIQPGFSANDTIICENETVTFTDTTHGISSKIDWDFGNGATPRYASGPGPHTIQYVSSGQSTATLSLDNNINVSQKIYINSLPSGQFYSVIDSLQCLGESFSLTFTDRNISSLQYQWYKDDMSINGKTDSLIQISGLTLSDSGSYQVILDNNGCYDTSEQIKLHVFSLPVVDFNINDSNQCLSGNNFQLTNTSSNANIYNWNFGDNNSSTVYSPSHSYINTGNYQIKLIATGDNQCQDSIQKNIDVRPMPVAGFRVNDSDQCLSGNSFSITNQASGAQNYFYDFGDGNTISAASPTHNYAAFGNYSIKQLVTTSFGCQDSLEKTIEVYSMPLADFSINDSDQCLTGNSFDFTNNSTNANNYFWDFGNGQTSTVSNPKLTYSKTVNYQVKLVAETVKGCKDSMVRNVYIREMPVVDFIIQDSAQCLLNNNFIFTNNSTGLNMQVWSFGDQSFSTNYSSMHQYTPAGSYKVKLVGVTQYGCIDSLEKTVVVHPMPVASFSSDTNQCLRGNEFSFTNNSSGASSYLWEYGNGDTSSLMSPKYSYLNAGDYLVKLTATTDKQCENQFSKKITVLQSPIADFVIDDSAQCFKGNNFNFTNTSLFNNKNFWSISNGLDTVNLNLSTAFNQVGEHTITLMVDTAGCQDSINKEIIVYPNPVADFTATNVCLGSETEFTNQSTIASPYQIANYKWMITATDSSLDEHPTFVFGDTGTYSVTLFIESDVECKDTFNKNIEVYSYPEASFMFTYSQNGEVTFNALDANAAAYKWYFGDGDSSNQKDPVHVYPHNLDYYPELFVTSIHDCQSNSLDTVNIRNITSVEEIIAEKYNLNIYPNPFDNTFQVNFNLPKEEVVTIEIYDSYGKLVKTVVKDILETNNHNLEIDASNYASGMYLVKVRFGDEEVMRRMVKM
jgi:PKD repeat protein/photosystem II stability/assembly factor-like uncharacterized protein